MVKVAILISGQPRFLSKTIAESLKVHLLDKYDCDIFCHFWWNPEGGTYKTSPWNGLGDLQIPLNVDKTIEELYHPKVMAWEAPPSLETFSRKYATHYNPMTNYNLPCMYYSMLKSYQLMKDSSKREYDWVIKLRYDEIIKAIPDLTKLDPDTVYSPHWNDYIPSGQLLIIPYKVSETIMSIYNEMDVVYSKCGYFNDEQMSTAHIHLKEIKHQHLPFDQCYVVVARG